MFKSTRKSRAAADAHLATVAANTETLIANIVATVGDALVTESQALYLSKAPDLYRQLRGETGRAYYCEYRDSAVHAVFCRAVESGRLVQTGKFRGGSHLYAVA